jgi:hypothetical protein
MLKMLAVTLIAALPPDLSVLTAARRVTTELEREKAWTSDLAPAIIEVLLLQLERDI